MARDTATSVAGAGADLLIAGGQAAGALVRSLWTAPPIRIPGRLIDKKVTGDIEIPPAVFLAAVGAFGLYIWARRGDKGISPFDWLWARVDQAALDAAAKKPPTIDAPGVTATQGSAPPTQPGEVVDVGATIPTETTVVKDNGTVATVKTQYRLLIALKDRPRATFDKITSDFTISQLAAFSYTWVVNGKTAQSQEGWYAMLLYSTDEGKTWLTVGSTGILWDNR